MSWASRDAQSVYALDEGCKSFECEIMGLGLMKSLTQYTTLKIVSMHIILMHLPFNRTILM